MFNFICKKLLHRPKPRFFDGSPSRLHIGRNTSPAAAHYLSTASENKDGGKKLKSSPPVVGFEVTKTHLKGYGFADTQISKLYNHRPDFFTSVPERTLLPKLDFFRGTVGFSNTDLPCFICSNPSLLGSSLQNQIVPLYNFIKALLLSNDDDDEIVLKILKRGGTRLLSCSLGKKIAPAISALTEAGVPHKHILHLLRWYPAAFGSSSLGDSIKRAAEMGFHPNKLSFVEAIRIFTQMTKSTWDNKMEAYRKCGFSDEEILRAFRKQPVCMAFSEGKFKPTMDFLVNKMGCHPADIARNPVLLTYSLGKRINPRCKVIKYLQAKGLLGEDVSLCGFLKINDKDFIDRFVKKYENHVPGLMDIFLGRQLSPQEQVQLSAYKKP